MANLNQLKKHRAVAAVDIDDDVYIIMLKNGYCYSTDKGCHVFGADSIKDAMEDLKMVNYCDCEDCKNKNVIWE